VEGDLDPSHNAFLHSNLATRNSGRIVPMMWAGENPPQFFDTDYGVQMVTVQTSPEGKLDVGVGHFIMTTATSVRGAGIVRQMNFRTPIDDENSFFFRIRYSQTGALDERELWEAKHGEYLYPPLLPGTFRPQANKSNDYLVDRVQQRFFNFSGIKSFIIQDVAVTDDQRGPMSDRTREHLVSVDEYIIRARKRLVRAARDLENGIEPKGPFMPETMSLLGSRFSVEPGTDLERAVREHIDVQLGRTVTAREAVAAGVLASE
jgi:hypothetical protein